MNGTAIMSANETMRFELLDERVVAGIETFVEVGKSLAEIRDSSLYRKKFATFEDYCSTRGIARATAYQLIDAAGVVENVRNCGQTQPSLTPTSESQVRPLTKLTPEQQREAWKEAVETAPDGKVTAKHVAQVVRRRTPEQQDFIDDAPLRALEKAEAETPREWNGRPIPADAPPLDLDVSDEPARQLASLVSYFQRGIARIPDKAAIKTIPAKTRESFRERFVEFAETLKEAV